MTNAIWATTANFRALLVHDGTTEPTHRLYNIYTVCLHYNRKTNLANGMHTFILEYIMGLISKGFNDRTVASLTLYSLS